MLTHTQRKTTHTDRAGRASGNAAQAYGVERPGASAQQEMQKALSQSPRVQSQLRLGQALNSGPRAVAQAKLAAALATRPAAETVAQRQTSEADEVLATQAKCASVADCAEAEDGGDGGKQLTRQESTAPVQPQRAPVQLRCDGKCLSNPGRVLHRESRGAGVLQGKFVYKKFGLDAFTEEIAGYIKTNHKKELVKKFRGGAASGKNKNFDVWADSEGIDWKEVLRDVVGFDPDWEDELFMEKMEGMPLTGYVPIVKTKGGKTTKMLEQVPRSGEGSYDYTADEDLRTLQTLRQISSQFYLYLQAADKLAEAEQEIQTMWAYGNLILASNNPATVNTLYRELTTIATGQTIAGKIYKVLTDTYDPKKFLGIISERHGAKLKNLAQSVREPGNDNLKGILDALNGGQVGRITDMKDQDQIKQVADTEGGIYLLTAKSLEGVSHAEQRLIEFRNYLQVYKKDPKAWVAGKKRPCFGCWIRERLTNEEQDYELVYMDQPGKAFMGTYRAAPPQEKAAWYDTLQDESLTFYESKVGHGEIGPESESEAEDELNYKDPSAFFEVLSSETLSKPVLDALDFHLKAAKVDPKPVKSYLKKRKKGPAEVESDQEDNLEEAAKKLKKYSESSINPAVKTMFPFKTNYKKKVRPKKKH